jgi:hypothetical protein
LFQDDVKLESMAERLRMYENRALNLFREVDLDHCAGLAEAEDLVTILQNIFVLKLLMLSQHVS